MNTQQKEADLLPADFQRPIIGPRWNPAAGRSRYRASGQLGWQSNGGPTRGHLARSLPYSLEVPLGPQTEGLTRVHLVGVFAAFASCDFEAPGTVGASVHLLANDREILTRFDLVNGRHYEDASMLQPSDRVPGDGTSLETIGRCELAGLAYRVDVLTLDVPHGLRPRTLVFKDLGSPASFVIFDVFLEREGSPRADGQFGRLAFNELGAAVRIGDRLRFARALEDLEHDIHGAEDIEDARSRGLAFITVVGAALLEASSTPTLVRELLEATRQISQEQTRTQLLEEITARAKELTSALFMPSESPADRLMDRALAIVERHYAKGLTDSMVAAQLGLSTSHFRFLFRQATGHPFHKYVVSLRLEKAKQMLIEREMPVSQVATAVGFTGLSHFSRAFTQRFSASPSHVRRAAG